jgi:hypothetical protein
MRDGRVEYVKMKTHRRAVENDNEAFYLRIAGAGDYRYEGADLGILLMRGRAMDENNQLTDRAKAWISGIRSYYQGQPLAPAAPDLRSSPFKIL